MALVRQVSKLLILLIISGCTTTTYKNSNLFENREVTITNSNNEEPNEKVEIPKVVENKLFDIENPVIGSISTMTMDGSDLWVGKLGGALIRYNIYTRDTKQIFKDKYSIVDYSIKKILVNRNSVYILQSNTISIFNKSSELMESITLGDDINRASDMIVLDNSLYITTLGYGLYSFDMINKEVEQISNSVDFLSSITTIDNKLYIGSMNNGLYIYDLNKGKYLSRLNLPLQFFNKNITKMNFNNDILYVGTAKNGLIKWDINKNSVDRLYKNQSVSSIFIDGDKTAISFIGFGVYIESDDKSRLESIRTFLKTNNITTVALLDNSIITGNLKKGIIRQEMQLIND